MTPTPEDVISTEPPFRMVPQRRAYEEIILQIEQALADGRLTEGDRLPGERELAETFGVSRSSVREALRVLETFGVLVVRRGTGADAGSIVAAQARTGLVSALRFHSALQRTPTADFVDLRAVIEAEAVKRAAGLDSLRTDELRALIEQMRTAATPERYHRLDTNFHVELTRISGNSLLPLLMEALREVMQRAMLRGFERLPDWELERGRLVNEHEAIIDLLEVHDGDGASEAVRSHIFRFYRDSVAGDGNLLS
jgi:GntR family transcriptional regulator, transcriptional repressor for pyruvate dehydrogenase complex